MQRTRKGLQDFRNRKRKHFELALVVWADGTVAEIQTTLLKIGAFDQGLLAAATERTDPAWKGPKIGVVVRNPQEYASVVEWGRRPRSGAPPPLMAIVAWAGRKGIVNLPRNMRFDGEWGKKWAASGAIFRNMKKGGRKGARSAKPMDPVIRDMLIVRLIRHKIYEKGIKGRHPFTKSYERRMRVLKKEVRDTLALLK